MQSLLEFLLNYELRGITS